MQLKCLLAGIVLVVLVGIAEAQDADFFEDSWEQFKIDYNRVYATPYIESQRFRIFTTNTRTVLAHNADFANGLYPYDIVINQFGDLTASEVTQQRNHFNRTQQLLRDNGYPFGANHHTLSASFRVRRAAKVVPEEINWVEMGAVTPVLDQAECGACWAHSAAGALEGQLFLKTGELVPLAIQQLVDCARDNGNNGCSGGVIEEAFDYVKLNGGLGAASDYPLADEQSDCASEGKNVVAMDSGYKRIPPRNEKKLMKAVGTIGPISVAIDASQSSFQMYKGGVYYEPKCAAGRMDHGVLVVGYGTDKPTGLDYWLVKNSWGTGWGENGYIRMARNKMNNCCIACYAAYPIG